MGSKKLEILGRSLLWAVLVFGCGRLFAAPPAPAGVTAAGLDGAVSLVWTPEPAATVYFLYRAPLATPTPTGTRTPNAVLPAPASSMTDFQVTNGKSYQFLLSAWDGSGEGIAAPVTAGPFGLPRPVEPLSVQALRSDSLDLTWSEPSSSFPVSYYQVFRHLLTLTATPTQTPSYTGTLVNTATFTRTRTFTPTGSATFTATPTFTGTLSAPTFQQTAVEASPIATVFSTSFTDFTVSTPGPHLAYYVVRAVDDQGHFGVLPNVEASSGVPQSNLPPAPPLLAVQILATPVPDTYGVRLSWTAAVPSEGVTAYRVLANATPIATLPVTLIYDDLSIPFGDLPGNSAVYLVQALNSSGSTGSNSVSIGLFKSRIAGLVQVTPDATGSVTLKWAAGLPGTYGLKGYRFYRDLIVPQAVAPTGQPTFTVTHTPTAFHTMEVTPSATPTLALTVGPGAHHGWRFWVEPFDQLDLPGTASSTTPVFLSLAPTPVATVVASGPVSGTNNRIDLSWPPSGAGFYGTPTAYFLYRAPAVAPTPVFVTPVPYPTAVHGDYAPGSPGDELAYWVRALDRMGNLSDLSPLSNTVTLGGNQPPEAPFGLSVTGDATSLRYGWLPNPATDAVTAYHLYDYYPVPSATPPVATMLPAATQTHVVTGLTTWNASFRYLVAENASGFSLPTTLAAVPVGPYSVLAAVPAPTRAVNLSWDITPTPGSTPALDRYVIYRSISPAAGFVSIGNVPITQTDFTDNSLPSAGTTFYYRVMVQANGGGQSAESPLLATPGTEGSILNWPKAPAGGAASGGEGSVVVSWSANPSGEAVTRYWINRNGTPVAEVTATPSVTLTWAPAEAPGTLASWSVVAENASGFSDPSAQVAALSASALTPVIGLTPPPGATPTPGSKSVWVSGLSYAGDVDSYVLYRSTTMTTTPTPVASISAPASLMRDPGVAGFVNFYRIVARSGGVEAGLYSSAEMPVTLWPNRPSLSMDTSDTAVTLSWAPSAGDVPVTAYSVYRAAYPNLTPTLIATVTSPGFTDSPLSTGSAHHYWVEAEGPGGRSGLQSPPLAVLVKQPPVLSAIPGPSRNTLTWSGIATATPSIAEGYLVYRAVPTTGTPAVFTAYSGLLKQIGSPTPSFVDNGLLDGVSYHYKVAYSGQVGGPLSGFSNEAIGTVAFGPVTGLVAASGDGVVQLRWEFQGAVGNTYHLVRKLGTALEDPSSYVTVKAGLSGNNYFDQGLANKTFFTYRIITVNAAGQAVTSAPVEALPARPPLLADSSVTVAQDQNGNTLTFWPANTSKGSPQLNDLYDPSSMYPVGGYRVYRSLDGGTYQLIGTAPVGSGPAGAVTYNHAGATVIGGSTLTYLVRAFDAPPDVDLSNSLLVHEVPYRQAVAKGLSSSTALDRNAIRPGGAVNEQSVNIRLVVESQQKVVIKVFTLSGTFVKKLLDQDLVKGVYGLPGSSVPINWDATNMNGTAVASGVYLIATEMSGGHREFQKVAVIR